MSVRGLRVTLVVDVVVDITDGTLPDEVVESLGDALLDWGGVDPRETPGAVGVLAVEAREVREIDAPPPRDMDRQ